MFKEPYPAWMPEDSMIVYKTDDEIARMRAAGRVVAEALNAMKEAIIPGKTTTNDLENVAVKVLTKYNASSPFLGYSPAQHPPFPAWTCISVNDQVVHGIPGRRVLCEGDIVGCDVGACVNGYFADGAWTFGVGRLRPDADRLLKVTEEALYIGIAEARPGKTIGDIGFVINRFVRKS